MSLSITRRRTVFIVASFLLALVLLLPLLLFPVRQAIFLHNSAEIRNLGPYSNRLERIVVSVEEYGRLNFTRPQHEFEYRGNMYDVHSIRRTGNSIIVTVLWDKAESAMLMAGNHQDGAGLSGAPEPPRLGFMPYFVSGRVDQPSPVLRIPSELTICIPRYYVEPALEGFSPPPELLS